MTRQNDSSRQLSQPQEGVLNLEDADLENVVGGGLFSGITKIFSRGGKTTPTATGATKPVIKGVLMPDGTRVHPDTLRVLSDGHTIVPK